MNEVKCIDCCRMTALTVVLHTDWEFGETKMVGVDWPVISAITQATKVWSIAADGRETIGQTK